MAKAAHTHKEAGEALIARTGTDRDVALRRKELERLGMEVADEDSPRVLAPGNSDVGFVVQMLEIPLLVFTRAKQRNGDSSKPLKFRLAVKAKRGTDLPEQALKKLGLAIAPQTHPGLVAVKGFDDYRPWEDILSKLVEIQSRIRGSTNSARVGGSRLKGTISTTSELAKAAKGLEEDNYFAPSSLQDDRKRTLREVVQRRGQPEFRKKLLQAYQGRCAATECDAEAALEAAHIVPYCGEDSNHISNGILLRADIHTLFDLNLIGVEPTTLTFAVGKELKKTAYSSLHGKPLRRPQKPSQCPNQDAIDERWNLFRLLRLQDKM